MDASWDSAKNVEDVHRPLRSLSLLGCFVLACALVCACGGGGGGGGGGSTLPAPTPSPAPTLAATSTVSVSAGAAPALATFSTIAAGYAGTLSLTATSSGSGSATAVLTATLPGSLPVVQATRRLPKAIGVALDPLVYVTLTPSATLVFPAWPALTFVLPANLSLPAGGDLYLAWYDAAAGGWTTLAGPGTIAGSQVTFAATNGPVTFTGGTTTTFVLFSTAQAIVVPTPTPTPSPSPTPARSPSPSPTPTAMPSASPTATASAADESAYLCPATGTASYVIARGGATSLGVRRALPAASANVPATTLLAVQYASATARARVGQIAASETAVNARFVRAYTFAHTGVTLRVVAVPTAALAQTEAAFRAQAGVERVGVTGARRYALAVTTPYYTNDPYFRGFGAYAELLPDAEGASVPGQWDMHAIGLEHAYGYSQAGNGSGIVNAAALGASSVHIAIIDTGEDANHPELSGQIVYQHCFITDENGNQSIGNYATDDVGHGTDVAGLAAAAPGNGLGFTGAGGAATIDAYRVFPTPDDTCTSDNTADDQCGADTSDIAAAIVDAVAQHANVISMSLGGPECTNPGEDPDPTEGAAVAEAIAANIIVVAASGNSGGSGVEAPACDSGVIAVGATGLDDGSGTGTTGSYTANVAGASAADPIEYVTSYTQAGSPAANVRSASAWGIVAPGGDPKASGADADDLHWIENVWTTTPFDANFAGTCTADYDAGAGSAVDCRNLIAGTSMATPHVAGAAALILAVNPSYQSPSAMKALLCATADDLADSREGCGRLNVYRAMATALDDPHPP